MHSTTAPSGLTYHHNGSFSGVVKTEIPVREQTGYPDKDHACAREKFVRRGGQTQAYVEVEIPFADMKHLVLSYLRSEAIGFLEQADDAALAKFFARITG